MTRAQHGSFTIERVYDAPVALVFRAWADKEAKARWFSAPEELAVETIREQNFAVGGRDRLRADWKSGRVTEFQCEYRDIVENARIVYVYEMYADGTKISLSLATITFEKSGKGTNLTVTEQGVFLDGYDDAGSRERGTNELMDKLDRSLQA